MHSRNEFMVASYVQKYNKRDRRFSHRGGGIWMEWSYNIHNVRTYIYVYNAKIVFVFIIFFMKQQFYLLKQDVGTIWERSGQKQSSECINQSMEIVTIKDRFSLLNLQDRWWIQTVTINQSIKLYIIVKEDTKNFGGLGGKKQ